MSPEPKVGAEDITLEQVRVEMAASTTELIVGFKNVHRGNKLAAVEDADGFVGVQLITFGKDERSFAEQVIVHAKKRANFWDARRCTYSAYRAERLSGGQAERLG